MVRDNTATRERTMDEDHMQVRVNTKVLRGVL